MSGVNVPTTTRSIVCGPPPACSMQLLGRGNRHVAGGHLGRSMPALANAGAVHDPFGIAAERGEIRVRHDVIGHVAAVLATATPVRRRMGACNV